jgi:transposase-like protein
MSLAEDAKPIMDLIEQKQNCPLCEHSAKFIGIDSGRKKKFYCTNCKVFVTHKDSVEDIAKLPKTIREAISKASNQCANDMVLLILDAQDVRKVNWHCEPESNWS